jgi:nucleoside-diphosphate-sugar epimerase
LKERWDAIIDFMVYETVEFSERVDTLLAATDQYVFISSARVFDDDHTSVRETSPRLLENSTDTEFLKSDEYALTKARQENLLRASATTNWTIVRPYITFGEGRLQLGNLEKEDWLLRGVQGRSIVFCRDLLAKKTTMTDGTDVAAMIAAVIGRTEALGEDFNVVGPETMTWDEVLSVYLRGLEEHCGARPKVILQDLETYCSWVSSVPQVRYDRMFNRCFDTSKLEKIFDVRSRTGSLKSLSARLQSQLQSGSFLPLHARGEALRDKAASEASPLSNFSGRKDALRYVVHRFVPQGALQKIRRN